MAIDINLTGVETTTNKGETVVGNEASTTKYLSIKGLYDWVTANFKATFSENTAFNKNFGTTAGTVAQGNDSRFDKNKTIVATTTTSSHTGNTSNTILYSCEIAAGTLTTNDRLYQELLLTAIGTNGVKTIKTYINTTNNLSGSPVLISTYSTNNLLYSLLSSFFIDSTTSMKSYKTGISNSATFWGSGNSVLGTYSIDFTVTQYYIVAVQLASAADVIQLEGVLLNRNRL